MPATYPYFYRQVTHWQNLSGFNIANISDKLRAISYKKKI